jgi:mRNA interferase RelE/StbE
LYSLEFNSSIKKDFKKIDKSDIKFIKDTLDIFVKSFNEEYEKELFRTEKIKKLQGTKETLYRLKLRKYRVIYSKEEEKLLILVVHITSRENAYR